MVVAPRRADEERVRPRVVWSVRVSVSVAVFGGRTPSRPALVFVGVAPWTIESLAVTAMLPAADSSPVAALESSETPVAAPAIVTWRALTVAVPAPSTQRADCRSSRRAPRPTRRR